MSESIEMLENNPESMDLIDMNPKPKIAIVGVGGFDAVILQNSPLRGKFDFSVHGVVLRTAPLFTNLDVNLYKNGLELLQTVDVKYKPDIVHVIGLFDVLPIISALGYPLIFTAIGHEVRSKGWKFAMEKGARYADIITVVSEDLMNLKNCPEHVQLVRNVADPIHFERKNDPVEGLHLIKQFDRHNADDDLALKKYKSLPVSKEGKLWINKNFYPYAFYPYFLEMFDHFFDFKFIRNTSMKDGEELPLSRTALELLTLGKCKVYHQDKILTELPAEYSYDLFVETWESLYDTLLEYIQRNERQADSNRIKSRSKSESTD